MDENEESLEVSVTEEHFFSSSQDHSVPCNQLNTSVSPFSPIVALVPEPDKITPTQQTQAQSPVPEKSSVTIKGEAVLSRECSHADEEPVRLANEKERSSYEFSISQDQGCPISDDDSSDTSFLHMADAFNHQYQDKREKDNSSIASDSFPSDAFLSSISQFKNLRKRNPAAITPFPSMMDPPSSSLCEQSDHSSGCSSTSHRMVLPAADNTDEIHTSNPGTPDGQEWPHPNMQMSCFVLLVPMPMYFENCFLRESCPQIEEGQQENGPATVPSHSQPGKITEPEFSPDAISQTPVTTPMLPPERTSAPKQFSRTDLPSTRMRVSPSPHKGSKNSPIITVSTTTTPIQPLRGKKHKYVIAQGNNRHYKGILSYQNSFNSPIMEEGHQPIYLQGLPPQGFRRLWKGKDTCTERITKRSLEPTFSKTLVSVNQEATVPQMDKSSPTCIGNRKPSDRVVPETSNETSLEQTLSTEETPDESQTSSCTIKSDGIEAADAKPLTCNSMSIPETKTMLLIVTGIKTPECGRNVELAVQKETIKDDVITIIPVSHGKCGEDKERKKIRDRKYDADLKKAFERLRSLIPRVQRNSSRGMILQEASNYIGILEKKVLETRLRSTLQAQTRNVHVEMPMEKPQGFNGETKHLPCSLPFMLSEVCSGVANEMLPEEESCQISLDNKGACLTSPIILSITTEDGPYSFVSPGGTVLLDHCEGGNDHTILLEDMPLSIPFPQIQLQSSEGNNTSPVLTSQSTAESLSEHNHTRFFPVIEVPAFMPGGEDLGNSHDEQISPVQDVPLSAMTTISSEGLSDLGVTLSPTGIPLSPGGDSAQSTTVLVVEDVRLGAEENVIAPNGVIAGSCTDMTSIAASVEVTTNHRKKSTSPTFGRTKRRPTSRAAQAVPSVSPLQVVNSSPCTPPGGNTNVLQDHSNFHNGKSNFGDQAQGKRRKLKRNRSPSRPGFDENSPSASDQNHTLPGRVSGITDKERRKTRSSRVRENKKKTRST
ncbi:uncharacterized protein [Montipora capricornis]|uniref:uncharacterized protein n=1 Tax=Montipora capricornis TaxID=246305 RepID=UPI0035F13212